MEVLHKLWSLGWLKLHFEEFERPYRRSGLLQCVAISDINEFEQTCGKS
jgi:hypothetical protein